jgi:protein-S-isoprenylcysteine O-methyltransferase Ste14
MRATLLEFKHRDLIIRLIYLAAFLCFLVDSQMVGMLLADWCSQHFPVFSPAMWKHAILFMGAALVALAAAIRTWATAYLRYDVMRDPRIHTDRLICAGPFAYIRNPLYFGNLLMVAGVSLMLSRTGAALLIAASVALIHRLVMREEDEMRQRHGEQFHKYCQAAPRWFPTLMPAVKPAGHVPDFRHGLTGELLLWIIAVALGVYAATFDLKLFGAAFTCAFIPGATRRIARFTGRSGA